MKLKITVDGKVYEVEVEATEPEPQQHSYILPPAGQGRLPVTSPGIPAPVVPTAGAPANENKVCRSPISGVVVRVPAQVGQTIQINDVLMVLEAMKMETVITSPIAGKISRINAATGEAVHGGQVLVEFE